MGRWEEPAPSWASVTPFLGGKELGIAGLTGKASFLAAIGLREQETHSLWLWGISPRSHSAGWHRDTGPQGQGGVQAHAHASTNPEQPLQGKALHGHSREMLRAKVSSGASP